MTDLNQESPLAEDHNIDWQAVGQLMVDYDESCAVVQEDGSCTWEEEDDDEPDGVIVYGEYLSIADMAEELWDKVWVSLDDLREELARQSEENQ